jgi:preprotein translocase subunit SecB
MENNQDSPIQESKPAGYRVESVLLIESSFKRHITDIVSGSISGDLKVDSQPHETSPDNKFAVTLAIDYIGKQNDEDIFSASVKMSGIFEKYGEPALTDDKFKAINAPAIIYPFVREYLYNCCLRAGIANVLLPTVNFKP